MKKNKLFNFKGALEIPLLAALNASLFIENQKGRKKSRSENLIVGL